MFPYLSKTANLHSNWMIHRSKWNKKSASLLSYTALKIPVSFATEYFPSLKSWQSLKEVLEHFALTMENCHPYPPVQCRELPIPSTACQSVPTLIDGERGRKKWKWLIVSYFTQKKYRYVWDWGNYLHIIVSEGFQHWLDRGRNH